MDNKIRIGIVDDKLINRTTIGGKIKQFETLDLCFSAVNGKDCLDQLRGLPLDKMPQVIFMDIEMPEMDGIQAISLAKPVYPNIIFIVLTIFDDDDKIFEAIKAGANGYLMKDESAEILRNAITNAVVDGGAPMSAAIARKAFDMLGKSSLPEVSKQKNTDAITSILSEREKEILQHTITGYDAKRIAEITGISVLTVRKHIANIYQKLHVNSKAQAMRIAYAKGLV